MPSKRTRRTHQRVTMTTSTKLHLLGGQCLLPIGCQVCENGQFKHHAALTIWRQHRESLLAEWRAETPAPPGFRGAVHGRGKDGAKCYAEQIFEGADHAN